MEGLKFVLPGSFGFRRALGHFQVSFQLIALAFGECRQVVTGAAGFIEVSGLTLAVVEEEKEVGISKSLDKGSLILLSKCLFPQTPSLVVPFATKIKDSRRKQNPPSPRI